MAASIHFICTLFSLAHIVASVQAFPSPLKTFKVYCLHYFQMLLASMDPGDTVHIKLDPASIQTWPLLEARLYCRIAQLTL